MAESERGNVIKRVHVFAGCFESCEQSLKYTEAQWEPEPEESASDDEYTAWENRNPTWALQSDLGIRLDADFIETIEIGPAIGDWRTNANNAFQYLNSMLNDSKAIERIQERASKANTLVLIFDKAVKDANSKFASTPVLTYCGEYPCELEKQKLP